jgi:carbonic anhydrase
MRTHLSRRGFLRAAGIATIAGPGFLEEAALASDAPHPKTPEAALRALVQGNNRYRKDMWRHKDYSPIGEQRAEAQAPFAAILTCADSRVSPPLIFDVERGNLFSTHVAGNSVSDDTLGSTEYAVGVLKVPLVVVLGHTNCGAVHAAIDVVAGHKSYPEDKYGEIGTVVSRVQPAVESVPADQRTLIRCIRANARVQAADLAGRGPIIAPAVASGALRVVPALYEIASGRVRFL